VHTVQVAGLGPEQVVALLGTARDAQLEPTSAVALTSAATAGRFDLGVRFEGFGKGVTQQVARLAELAKAAGAPAEPLSDDAAAAFWRRHDAVRTAQPLRVRVAAQPSQFPAVAGQLARLGPLVWYATLGVGFAGGEIDSATAGPAITAARAALVAGGGSLVIEHAPAGLGIEPWGPPPPSFAIMQRLKRRFDPDGRLNPGRFVGGL
jgi:glycolate oxidase FAD binding subunit